MGMNVGVCQDAYSLVFAYLVRRYNGQEAADDNKEQSSYPDRASSWTRYVQGK